jgi:hypothetical protein
MGAKFKALLLGLLLFSAPAFAASVDGHKYSGLVAAEGIALTTDLQGQSINFTVKKTTK